MSHHPEHAAQWEPWDAVQQRAKYLEELVLAQVAFTEDMASTKAEVEQNKKDEPERNTLRLRNRPLTRTQTASRPQRQSRTNGASAQVPHGHVHIKWRSMNREWHFPRIKIGDEWRTLNPQKDSQAALRQRTHDAEMTRKRANTEPNIPRPRNRAITRAQTTSPQQRSRANGASAQAPNGQVHIKWRSMNREWYFPRTNIGGEWRTLNPRKDSKAVPYRPSRKESQAALVYD